MRASMLIDARKVRTALRSDLCVIGGGAAGIALVRALAGTPHKILLLESGGFSPDAATQSLCAGPCTGIEYSLTENRLRYFGGTTNHWGGQCRPLDEIDFEARPGVARSGWPIPAKELRPYYESAQGLCELGPFHHYAAETVPPVPARIGERVEARIFQHSPPTRFGEKYRSEIARAENISLCLNANVTALRAHRSDGRISGADVRCLNGNRFSVSARIFVLAAGGIENARLMLASNDVFRDGLGNERDLVGRCFMLHPDIRVGVFLRANTPPARALTDPLFLPGGVPLSVGLALSQEILRGQRRKNMCLFLGPAGETAREFDRHVAGFDADLRGEDTGNAVLREVHAFIEQEPQAENRITLSPDRDPLGQPRAALRHRLEPAELRALAETAELVGIALAAEGHGRLKINLDPEAGESAVREYSSHHMGTTRMHDDPAQGVVDRDCRVHGLKNLYVTGSSVFTTSGVSNPTLTIVALALRLADRLKRELA
jgi:choline dehydrogenase-like flavoprotein